MKFLLDTNELIPVEPGSLDDVEPGTAVVAEFIKLCNEAKQQLYVHPVIVKDLERDKNDDRRQLRKMLIEKYAEIPHPPALDKVESVVGAVDVESNDWVDHHLLAAILGNAADYLVTEDDKIHRKAERLRIADRVVRVADAIQIIKNLFDRAPQAPPAVESTFPHLFDISDPIFDSFRIDYPGFDAWLKKCQLEHRQTWAVRLHPENKLAAVSIVNKEENPRAQWNSGKTLKICSFKVDDDHLGLRLGELLLKTVFGYAAENRYDSLFVTAFPKQVRLVELFQAFGFEVQPEAHGAGELVLLKRMSYSATDAAQLSQLEFHIKYGPFITRIAEGPAFIVPIQPKYHAMLFPEAEDQTNFLAGQTPFGNSIRKAYLCHAGIKSIVPGSSLLFYRSHDYKAVTTLGIAEGTIRSNNPAEIARFVGKRTVYRYEEIVGMCTPRAVLAIQFRQVRLIRPSIKLGELQQVGILTSAPQSIVTVSEEGKAWVQKKLQM